MTVKILQLNSQGAFWYKAAEISRWCVDHSVDIVSISESWLCDESCRLPPPHICHTSVDIPGWVWVGRPRGSHGGGVGFLIKDYVPFRVRPDLEVSGVECSWIEVL